MRIEAMPKMPPHRARAIQTVTTQQLGTYWQIGPDIVESGQRGKVRADYGKALLQSLSRGMAVKGIDSALSSPMTGDGTPLRRGQDSIVVSTFPKP
jgi:hypothetical protein